MITKLILNNQTNYFNYQISIKKLSHTLTVYFTTIYETEKLQKLFRRIHIS